MRVKGGTVTRRRHKRLLKAAEGFRGRRKNCYRLAKLAVQKARKHAYIGRRLKKRDFRGLWIVRISAAAKNCGISYSKLMCGLKRAGVELNRKALSEMAIHDAAGFAAVAERAKTALTQ